MTGSSKSKKLSYQPTSISLCVTFKNIYTQSKQGSKVRKPLHYRVTPSALPLKLKETLIKIINKTKLAKDLEILVYNCRCYINGCF